MNEEHSAQTKKCRAGKWNLSRFSPRRSAGTRILLVLLFTAILIVWGCIRMKNAYTDSRQNTYSDFYQPAYDFGEKKYHVSNDTQISIDAAQEVSRLEVLTVSDSEFVIKDADANAPTISWLEVQGTGVFTVDMTACEFIADSERQYVLARVPKPALTEFSVSGTGKQFWQRNTIFNGSIADGVQLNQAQLKEGQIKLEDSMKQNRGFYEAAKDAAISMIGDLVRQWNPDISNLQVDVEFFEDN